MEVYKFIRLNEMLVLYQVKEHPQARFFLISSVINRGIDKSESITLSSDNKSKFDGGGKILNI